MTKWLIILALLASNAVSAAENPPLWGYGVQSCRSYLAAFNGAATGQEAQVVDYMRFQDWLAGFVSGLSVATGGDILRGVTIEGALRRIQIYCVDKPDDDFFTATRSFIRMLNALDHVE